MKKLRVFQELHPGARRKLSDPMSSDRCVADVNLGHDPDLSSVETRQRCGKCGGVGLFHQVDGAAAKASAGKARADKAGQILSQTDHGVSLKTACIKVPAVAEVRLGHEAAQFGEVALDEGLGSGNRAQVFGNDVAGSLEGIRGHFMAPFFEIVHGGITEEADTGAVAGNHGAGGLDLCAAGGVFAANDGVFHHGVGDDEGHVLRNGREGEAQVAAIEQKRVVFGSVCGDELVHDAATGADKLVFSPLAETGQDGSRISYAY